MECKSKTIGFAKPCATVGCRGEQIQVGYRFGFGSSVSTQSFSRIHAFDDKVPIGRARDDYKRFSRVLHQVREPLTSITSLCTEPFNRDAMKSFIQRHIKLESSREQKPVMSRVCLEMVGFTSFELANTVPTN